MTADNTNETMTTAEQGSATKSRSRKAASRKASPKSGAAAKRAKPAAASAKRSRSSVEAQGASESGRSRRSSRGGSRSRSSSAENAGIASRVLSGGRRAAAWAVDGASRAMPLAVNSLPDQRMVQRFVDERPYMLGALGLGIGAVIGLMLPSTLSSMSAKPARSNTGRKSR